MNHFYFNSNFTKKAICSLGIFFLTITAFSQTSIPELVFKNPTVIFGLDGVDGAIYKFANVATGIDAQVKINGRSSLNVTLADIDINSTGFDNAFQPLVNYTGGSSYSASTVTDWYIEFQISFVKAGTITPISVTGFDVTGIDIDGTSAFHEYLSFYSLNTFTLENPTELTATSIISGGLSVGERFDGATNDFTGIDAANTTVMVTNHYLSTSTFKVRVGGKAKGPFTIGSGGRQNSLWFKSFTYGNPVVSTLPLVLVDFNGRVNDNGHVALSWATSSEINASHFEVERSLDGSNYTEEGMIFTEEGNSSTTRKYAYNDNISSVTGSVIYYRLKMVDKDGRYMYSEVVLVRLTKSDDQIALLAYPNPAVNEVSVSIPNEWQNKTVSYSIYSLGGLLIKQKTSSNASQTETFNIANVPAGMYIIKVTNDSQTAIKQFIKTR